MTFIHDRRGQSVVVGAVVLFGFLIISLAVYQALVVPQENTEVEFEHSQEVEGDFVDLRNSILSAGRSGDGRSTSVKLGTRYPQRTFFVNPPPATGSLETTSDQEIDLNDITINESAAHENIVSFWNDGGAEYRTRSVRYTANYNEFQNAPTLIYEHSIVGAEFPSDATLFRTDQTAVRSDRISLTTLSGTVSEDGVEARSVDPEAVSQGARTVPIDVEAGDSIVLPTALSDETRAAELWTDRFELKDIPVTAEPVEGNGEIRIEFMESDQYDLRLSEVSIDGQGTSEPAYIVPVGSEIVSPNSEIGVEVRDKYNNPVSGSTVTIDGGSFTTNDDGRVFTSIGSNDVTASIGEEDWQSVEFEISDTEERSGDPEGLNPSGGDNRVILDDIRGGQSSGVSNSEVELTFRNDAEESIVFEEIAYNLYYDGSAVKNSFTIEEIDIELRGGFKDLPEPLSFEETGDTNTITLEFDSDARGSMIGITFIDDDNRRTIYITGVPGPGN
ncbi:Ig-like domain-containing protein [Halorubrum vacuolatum]|uniref:Uncharacterized protein n=1 Tax=Halorubrum vacuolatum TaxID=63740 RepID=A0A238V9N4_HALVU|nr:hypothetical protein [Halorubrum vacuolatum]SNR31142.1 hypothetical protein SAMN06264855_102146 [Halorubrum vacuolatum]